MTNNPGEKLKKDMYVTARSSAGTINDAIAVPDAAVLRDGEISLSSTRNVFQSVRNAFGYPGESLKGQTEVTSGLKSGDRVIGDGSLFLQFANSLQR